MTCVDASRVKLSRCYVNVLSGNSCVFREESVISEEVGGDAGCPTTFTSDVSLARK